MAEIKRAKNIDTTFTKFEGEMVVKDNLVKMAEEIDGQATELEIFCQGLQDHVWQDIPERKLALALQVLESSQKAAVLLVIAGKLDPNSIFKSPDKIFFDVMNATSLTDIESIGDKTRALRKNFPWNKTEEIVKG